MNKWLTLNEIDRYAQVGEDLKVSIKARTSKDGFMFNYRKAGGNPNNLSEFWIKKRNAFVARTLAAYNKNPTFRRWLSLVFWAYKTQ